VRALGIHPPGDRSRGYRTAAAATYVAGLVLTPALAALTGLFTANGLENWWPLFVFFAVAWQAGLVWLIAQLLRLQSPNPAEAGGGPHR
jgi:hypothetical protein